MTADPRVHSKGRRRLLETAAAAVAAVSLVPAAVARAADRNAGADNGAARSSHFPFGPVVPVRPIPAWPVVTQETRRTDLASLLRGRTSALQLMFTGCSATCPIQGALFAQAQRELHGSPRLQWQPPLQPPLQLLSLSIDPLADTPAALTAWLRQFAALPGWSAAAPRPEDVDRVFEVLTRGGESRPGGNDRHTGQVFIVDRRGNLAYRTPSMPAPAQIVALLRLIDERP